MMKIKLAGSVLLAAVLAATALAQGNDNEKPYFGSGDDVAFAGALWQAMLEARLVGPGAINVYPFEGNQPHGAIQQVTDSVITVEGRSARVIVKRNHGGEGVSVKSVYASPQAHLKAVTVMFKREAGYDSENADWFWAKYTPVGALDKNPKGVPLAGRIGKGGGGGCIACHTALGGADLETLTGR